MKKLLIYDVSLIILICLTLKFNDEVFLEFPDYWVVNE